MAEAIGTEAAVWLEPGVRPLASCVGAWVMKASLAVGGWRIRMKKPMSGREITLLQHLGQRRLELVFTETRISALGGHGADAFDGML